MAKKEENCSFCGRKKTETEYLISGISAFICDSCIDQAFRLVHEDLGKEPKNVLDIKLLKPLEIKKHLVYDSKYLFNFSFNSAFRIGFEI